MPCLPRRRRLFALALAAVGFGSVALAAQLQSNKGDSAAQETIDVQAGDILEILPVHSLTSATYSWILTQDRNFIEVARSAFYNTRLTTPGRFTLNAEVSAATGQAVLRRVFTIDVLPRRPPPADTAAPAPSTTPLVRAEPEPDSDGRVILPPRRELLLLTPLHSDFLPLHLDLDARNDADDDGTLTNDSDNAGTFFQTSGTPLHLWFTNATEQRDITLHADSPDGAPLTQALSVLPAAYAMQRGLFVSRVLIATEERGPKALLFSPQFEDGGAPAIPLAFHWDFGDASESIEERPLHEFASYGTYSVRLSVRNIETGRELAARTKAIALQAPLIRDPRDDAPPPALPPEPPAPPQRASFLRIVFTIIGVAVGFAAIGFAVAWGYRAAQAYLLKRRAPPPPAPVPPKTAPPAPPKSPPPPKPQPQSPPPPTAPKEAPTAPDWLKKTAPPSPKPSPPSSQPPTAPLPSPPLPTPPPPPEPKQQSPAPAAIRVAPHPNPLPRGEGTTTHVTAPTAPLAKQPPQPPVAPQPPVPPKPQPPQKAPPATPPKTLPPPPAVPTISTVPSVPPPESDRTIAIVQAENLPPPPKPPTPPSPPSPQPPPPSR